MISFFRKIRQKLLSQNRITRYLVYAVGEIVLVVIGILIALEINTANDYKKDRALESKYLKGILSNLESDITELATLIHEDSLQLNGYTTLIRAFSDKTYKEDPNSMLKTIFLIQLVNSFEGNSVVFEDLKSSGRTNLIQSDSLRYQLLRYQTLFQALIKEEESQYNPIILEQKNKLFITAETGINPVENLFFPDYWASPLPDTKPLNSLSFLDGDIASEKVKLFANRAGYIKALIWTKQKERKWLLVNALELRQDLQNFLEATSN